MREKRALTFFKEWKWVLLFLFISMILLENSLFRLNQEKISLENHLTRLNAAVFEAEQLQDELTLQINSQSDPAWIELVLKKELGLVKENETKVLFLRASH